MTLFYLHRFSPYNLLLRLNCLLQQLAIKLIEPGPANRAGPGMGVSLLTLELPPGDILLSKTFIVGRYYPALFTRVDQGFSVIETYQDYLQQTNWVNIEH